MSIRTGSCTVVLLAGVLVSACFGHDVVKIVYENQTGVHITLWIDGERFAEMEPGALVTGDEFPRYLPDHVEAFDDEGRRVFDLTVDLDALEAMDFKVIIRKQEP